MDLGSAAPEWQTHGFVILPGFVLAAELKPALDELSAMYPTAEGFHDGTDERRDRFAVDEWAGIDSFPFRSTELSLLAVSDRVTDVAETLLADGDLRISSAEAWAKYSGAADYDQPLHRDYLSHTLMVPARAEWGQRMPWAGRSHELEWYRFAHRATPRQLALFGFPPPGHPYWTEATFAGTAQRYPGLNMTPWQQALRGEA